MKIPSLSPPIDTINRRHEMVAWRRSGGLTPREVRQAKLKVGVTGTLIYSSFLDDHLLELPCENWVMAVSIACANRNVEGTAAKTIEGTSVNLHHFWVFMADVKFAKRSATFESALSNARHATRYFYTFKILTTLE